MRILGNHDAVIEARRHRQIEELIRSAELLVVTLRTLNQSTNSDFVEELERLCDSLAVQIGVELRGIDYSGFLISQGLSQREETDE